MVSIAGAKLDGTRVLVTGGTGVVGNAAVAALLGSSHPVRLLTRHADTAARVWPEGVEPWPADVGDRGDVRGAAAECDAVVHIAGAVRAESEGELDRLNVRGTRHAVDEAAGAGVRRFVFVSSLGAERGSSDYHRSKRDAEAIVRQFEGEWVILRPGMVYGPGDEVVSVLLRMLRSLPLMPVVGRARPFQPIWHEDLGAAIAAAVDRVDVAGRILEVAGSERTDVDDLLDRLERITERAPPRVPLPSFAAKLGAVLAERFAVGSFLSGLTGDDTPLDSAKLTMLEEENVVRAEGDNALTNVFGIDATPLDEGLRRLVRDLPEQLPQQGEGPLERKRFWALIRQAGLSAGEAMRIFRAEAATLLPFQFAAGGAPTAPLEAGMTLTLVLPLRGEVQVRVEEATDDHVTLATLEGHPLAGIVRFIARPDGDALRFLVEIFARSANVLDSVMMSSGGAAMQRSTWRETVERMIHRAGGTAPGGVHEEVRQLEEEEAAAVEAWVAAMVEARKRVENERATGSSRRVRDAPAAEPPPEPAA